MNRKEFLTVVSLSVLGSCRHDKAEPPRQLLLEADLRQELLLIGSYKINSTIGLFVRRIASGNTPQDFDCFWMICTHARCFVGFDQTNKQFACPCHGSEFNIGGQVLQGPAASPLEKKAVEIYGNFLRVFL